MLHACAAAVDPGCNERSAMRRAALCFAFCSLLTTGSLSAQDVRLNTQVRPRFEWREPGAHAAREDFTSMRTRLGATALLPENISVFVQIQDVRIWGQDATVGEPVGFPELHQGFLAVERIAGGTNGIRAGRQEITFGAQRLVGNADWAQRARSFDGVRATFGSAPRAALDLFTTQIADREAGRTFDASFHGIHATLPMERAVSVELYGLYNRARTDATTDQGTVGTRLTAAPGVLSVELEAAYQFGDRADRRVSAYMLRAAAGPSLPFPAPMTGRVLIAFEHYSGGDPVDADVRVFDALFGTAHAFLGYADLFTNIPAHTAGRGIQDLGVRAILTPRQGTDLLANAHIFRSPPSAGLPSRRFGEELDLRLRHRMRAPLTFTGGFSYVWQGPALAAIGRLDRDMTFVYAMLSAVL
jgi:hypothetical protein